MMIAALVAAQLPVAAGAQAARPQAETGALAPAVNVQGPADRGTKAESPQLALADAQAPAARADEAAQPSQAEADRPKKHKSTGDKVLTGAAVLLGIGALAVGGLLIAIFVR